MSADRPPSGIEKRQRPRFEMVNFVWFHLLSAEGGPTGTEGICKMVDLSETGVGILVVGGLVSSGSRVFLSINTRAGALCMTGKVAFSRPESDTYTRVGIQFEVVPPQHRVYLKSLEKEHGEG